MCPYIVFSFSSERQIIIAVRLSAVFLRIAYLKMASTPLPANSCEVPYLRIALHAISIAYIDSIRSKIPSQQRRIKSYLPVNRNFFIYGYAEITPLVPPNCYYFASISPIVRETDSFPGNILKGPMITSGFYYFFARIFVISVR